MLCAIKTPNLLPMLAKKQGEHQLPLLSTRAALNCGVVPRTPVSGEINYALALREGVLWVRQRAVFVQIFLGA